MKHALPPLTKDLLEAFAASAVAWLWWLLGVIAGLGAPHRGRRLRRCIEIAERAVECIMFLRTLHRSRLGEAEASLRRSLVGPLARRRRFPRPAPSGFRRSGPVRRRRQLFRDSGVRARKAGFLQRVVRLVAALADPEPHGFRGRASFPSPRQRLRLVAQLPRAVALTDSS